MENKLNWKKDWFSDEYSVFSGEKQVGSLKDKFFSQTSNANMNGREYIFRTKGLIDQHTEIIDPAEDKAIGEISYNSWMTKATISLPDKTILWEYDNLWNTKWSLSGTDGIKIRYSGSSTNGEIDSNTEDELIILSGLFVTNYYWQMTIAILIIVFIPKFSIQY